MSLPQTPPSLEVCPFTAAELDWLWPKYQACSFPPGSFQKRFARNPLSQLTPDKGWRMAALLAFQYRRQIFGKKAGNWDAPQFIRTVKAKAQEHHTALAEVLLNPLPPPRTKS
jgi:hypothetical protein